MYGPDSFGALAKFFGLARVSVETIGIAKSDNITFLSACDWSTSTVLLSITLTSVIALKNAPLSLPQRMLALITSASIGVLSWKARPLRNLIVRTVLPVL